MVYGSVCSGIEAATVAWHPLGWRPAFFAEIAKFPSKVLQHHYPAVPNAGDFTQISAGDYDAIDLLVGGTPCQDFSVAGLRAGLDGARGQLTIEYALLAARLSPRWLVWENVPGVLSSDGGRAFGLFLGLLGQLGYGLAYRVLDAQYAGVPQRRRRVFVVGHLGNWRRAAAVLFERHSLSGHPAPRREAGQVAPCIPARSLGGGGLGTDFDCDGGLVCNTADSLTVGANQTYGFVGEIVAIQGAAHRENAASGPDGAGVRNDGLAYTLEARSEVQAVAFDTTQITSEGNYSHPKPGDPCHPLAAGAHAPTILGGTAVRRLTPRECERLQGFPDDYTLLPGHKADGPRYKALGNSMAVPVMRWIGKRIAQVEGLC